jgi:hypothetical protein
MPVRRALSVLFARAQDPQPELGQTAEPLTGHTAGLGLLPILSLAGALGLFAVAHSYTSLRLNEGGTEGFFWLGILLIFAPSSVRLISPDIPRFERIALVCMVAMFLYLVFVIKNPVSFSPYDAFLHWRTAQDIIRTEHLFSENTLLPASPYYPGLEIVTNALGTIGGLSIHQSGAIVIGVARIIMVLSLFFFFERATNSSRMAGMATLLYMVNPHFMFFDADYSYESLALPMGTFLLFVLARQETLPQQDGTLVTAFLALSSVVVTHHLTSYVFVALLMTWIVICILQRPTPRYLSNLLAITWFGIFAILLWTKMENNPVVPYLSSYFRDAFYELTYVLTRGHGFRQLFADYSGIQPIPTWQRLLAISSTLLILGCLLFGLLCLWARDRQNPLMSMLGAVALVYPVIQLFRFTHFGDEIPGRAAAFLFIPLAVIIAISIVQFFPVRTLRRKQAACITCAMSIMFLGGVVSPSWLLFPGSYLVAADPRSVEPEGRQAAGWARLYLGPNNHIATDRINSLLMHTYGDQRVQSGIAGDLDVTSVFFSTDFDSEQASSLRESGVRFLVVDQRLTTALPAVGFYFEPGEPGSFLRQAPLSSEALAKFRTVAQIDPIFNSGSIVIYDIQGLADLLP